MTTPDRPAETCAHLAVIDGIGPVRCGYSEAEHAADEDGPEMPHPFSPLRTWYVGLGGRRPLRVKAADQFEAWNTLRVLPARRFGLVVSARLEGQPDDEAFLIRTSELFGKRWGDNRTARLFIDAAIAEGLGDTSAADLRPDA